MRANLTGNQLDQYRKKVLSNLNVTEAKLYCVFIRTTFASPPLLAKVNAAGYAFFSVYDYYKALLPEATGTKNTIVREFWQHLIKLNANAQAATIAFKQFASLPIGEWTWWHWHGFMYSQQQKFSAGISQTVRRSTLLAFYYGGTEIDFRFPRDRFLQYKPYADLVFEVGKNEQRHYRMSLRLGLPGKLAETQHVRQFFVDKLQPLLKAKGVVTEKTQYRSSAKSTVSLVNIILSANLTSAMITERLHLLQQLLIDLPKEVIMEA